MNRVVGLFVALVMAMGVARADGTMGMAVNPSFHNSGFSDVLLPVIEKGLSLTVQLLVVGNGQALRLGRANDVDAILVHSRQAEQAFVTDGDGTHRRELYLRSAGEHRQIRDATLEMASEEHARHGRKGAGYR